MNELTYTCVGDYYIPNLKLSGQPQKPIGKYGRMRQRDKEYRCPSDHAEKALKFQAFSASKCVGWRAVWT